MLLQPFNQVGQKRVNSPAFSLIELLCALVIVAILAALLIPMFRSFKEKGNALKCLNNQKQIVSGIHLYAADNQGALPPYYRIGSNGSMDTSSVWTTLIQPYIPPPPFKYIGLSWLRCPSAPKTVSTTIGVNYAEVANVAPFGIEGPGRPGSMKLMQVSPTTVLTADIQNPSGHAWFLNPRQFPLTVDSDGDGIADTRPGNPPNNWFMARHSKSAVCSFADGSVRLVTLKEWGSTQKLWGP